jgi:hypothetical protein
MQSPAVRRVIAGALVFAATVVVGPASPLRAQARFELLSRDSFAGSPDITVSTIRDRRTSTCYALFIGGQGPAVGPLTAPAPVGSMPWDIVEVTAAPPPPTAYGSAASITPWPAGYPGLWGSPGSLSNWGVPAVSTAQANPWGTIPWAAANPGMQTGGWELMAESVRRALVDPSTVQAMSAPLLSALTELDDRMRRLELLMQTVDASRTVAVWPVSCAAAKP